MKAGDLVRLTWSDGDKEIGIFQREERGFAVLNCSGRRVVGCLASLEKIEVLKQNENLEPQEYNRYMGIESKNSFSWKNLFLFVMISSMLLFM